MNLCDLCKHEADAGISRPDVLVVNNDNTQRSRPLYVCTTCAFPEKQTGLFRMTLQHLSSADLVGGSRSAMTVARKVQVIAANALYKGEVPK